MRLSEFILCNMEAILQSWEDFANSIQPEPYVMDVIALRDHAEDMVKTIAADLASPQSADEQYLKSLGKAAPNKKETAAEIHARLRLADGFDINQLVAEYRALRASVLLLWSKQSNSAKTEELVDMTRFNEAIDQAITESIAQFSKLSKEQEEIRRSTEQRLLEEAEHLNAMLMQKEQRLAQQVQDWERLHELSKRLLEPESGQDHLLIILQAILDFHSSHQGQIALYQHNEGVLVPRASIGLSELSLERLASVPTAEGACGLAFTSKRQIIVEDTEIDPLYAPYRDFARSEGIRAVYSTPFFSRSGQCLGIVSVYFSKPRRPDEREMRLIDICIKHASLFLERKHAEEELRLADRRKDEFLAMLAHELRNPLAPISAGADLLRLLAQDEPRLKQISQIISRQVTHVTDLVSDLLDVSRVTTGKIILHAEVIDIKPVISEAVEQVYPLIEARHHHLALHLAPETITVNGDYKRLVQVVTNLLNNAAKYTPEGGSMVVRLEKRDGQAMISIRDSGIGMTEELVAHAFELFVQAEQTSDRSLGGMGLGLALVKNLVELHDGSVHAFSRGLGGGSEFTVFLPTIDESTTKRPDADISLVERMTKPLRVLLVDDNVDAAESLAMVLQAAGHEVFTEHTSRQALERAIIERPNVCILDIGLPDFDGSELARQLRSHAETSNAVLIALTGYGHDRDREKALAAGFNYHFVKPVISKELVTLLADLSRAPGSSTS